MNVPAIRPLLGRLPGLMETASRSGAVPLTADRVSQLSPSAVMAWAVLWCELDRRGVDVVCEVREVGRAGDGERVG